MKLSLNVGLVIQRSLKFPDFPFKTFDSSVAIEKLLARGIILVFSLIQRLHNHWELLL